MTRHLRFAALIAGGAVLLGGCASSPTHVAQRPASSQAMTPGMVMQAGSTMGPGEMTPGMVMPNGTTMSPGAPGTAPSKAAKMICTDEVRDDITTVLSVALDPKPVSTWRGGTYTCTYRLPMGSIVLSVHESADVPSAVAYTGKLRPSLPGAKDLVGLTKLAFGTADGVLVLQKDNDTLRVDTSGLQPQSKLYKNRAVFAYSIATVIMGCWTGSPTG
jgi:hypothetical protein